jgi:hypothetical protein
MAAGNRDGDEAREASGGRDVVGSGEVVEFGAELENIWVEEATDESLYGKAVVAKGADVEAGAATVVNWVAIAVVDLMHLVKLRDLLSMIVHLLCRGSISLNLMLSR